MSFFAKTAQRASLHGGKLRLLRCSTSREIASAAGAQVLPSQQVLSEEVTIRTKSRRDAIQNAKPFSSFLTDTFQRQHDYLRISVTEKCNLRCLYCMPEEGVPQSPPPDLLTSSEIFLLSSTFVSQGVTKIRLTGGEPTVRRDILPLMHQIGTLRSKGLRELCLTTNGISLHRKLDSMVESGLTGVNLSLDTLDPWQFQVMTRRKGLDAVMKSIERVLEMNKLGAGIKLKINCVVMRGMNDQEILPFVELGREQDLEVRFIEYMPFDGNKWSEGKMLPFQEMLDIIRAKYPGLKKVQDHKNDTSKTYHIPGFVGKMGFITSMTHNFCGTCNRLRITSDGNLKVCLFGNDEVSLRDILRKINNGRPIDEEALEALKNSELRSRQGMGSSSGPLDSTIHERELLEVIGLAVKGKREQHAGIGDLENMKNRPMILIEKARPRNQPSSLRLHSHLRPRQNIPNHLLYTPLLSQQIRNCSSGFFDSVVNKSVAFPVDGQKRPDFLDLEQQQELQVKARGRILQQLTAKSFDSPDSSIDRSVYSTNSNQESRSIIRRAYINGPRNYPQSHPTSIAYSNKLAKLAHHETPKTVKILPTVQRFTISPWTGHRTSTFHKDSMLVLEEKVPKVEKPISKDPSWAEIYEQNITELKTAKLAYKKHIKEKLTQYVNSSQDNTGLKEQLLQKLTDAYAAARLAREQLEQQHPMSIAIAKILKNQPLFPLRSLPQLTQSLVKEEKEIAKRSEQPRNREEAFPSESSLTRNSTSLVRRSRGIVAVEASNLTGFRYPIVEEGGKTVLMNRDDLEEGEELSFRTARTRRSNLLCRNSSRVTDTQTPLLKDIETTNSRKRDPKSGEKLLLFEPAPIMMRKGDSASVSPNKSKITYVKLSDSDAIVPQPLDERWTVVSRELMTTGTGVLWKHFPEHFGPNGEQLKPFHPVVERSLSSFLFPKFRSVKRTVSLRSPPSTNETRKPVNERDSRDKLATQNIQSKSASDVNSRSSSKNVEPESFKINGSRPTAVKMVALLASNTVFSSRSFSTSSSVTHPKLTHLTPSGSAHMVDIATKEVTPRTAVARCNVDFSNSDVLPLIKASQMKKGDVLGVARVAGIMAAKRTSDLIPLCHPIAITNAIVELEVREPDAADANTAQAFGSIVITASVSCDGKTGVEMEALTACSAAALTVYDMCKAVDKGMRIQNLRVVRKSGGRSGDIVENNQTE